MNETNDSTKKSLYLKNIGKVAYYAILLSGLLFSFWRLSPFFSFHYDSDVAVHILQAADFNFRTDWYYWGQNRLGSFVPLLGFLIHKILPLGPAWSVSIANYLVLLGTFWAFSRILTDRYARLLLFFVLFLPYYAFTSVTSVGFPYPPKLLFLGLTLFWINKLTQLETNASLTNRATAYASLVVLFSILSVWISEYSLVFLFFIYANAFLKKFKEFRGLPLRGRLYFLGFPLLLCCLGAYLIYRIKHANPYPSYSDRLFVNKEEFNAILSSGGRFLTNQFNFFTLDHFIPVAVLSYILIYWKAIWVKSKYFIALVILSVFPVCLLHWVYINDMDNRYFAPAYFFLWVALILSAEKNINRCVFLSIVVCLQVATLYQKRFAPPYRFQRLQAFKTLGKCGIIGDYWSSYNISAANFDSIAASPHPQAKVRNPALLDTVLNREKIYLISNNWLSDFPIDVVIGKVLLKKVPQTEIQIDAYYLCQYRKHEWKEALFTVDNMSTSMGKKIGEGEQAYWETKAKARGFVWYGPYIPLQKGKYSADYQLIVEPLPGADTLYATLDVCTRAGNHVLGKKIVTASNAYIGMHTLTFVARGDLEGVEFRIGSFGNAVLKIEQIRVTKK
jgi:hypothetical protein